MMGWAPVLSSLRNQAATGKKLRLDRQKQDPPIYIFF